jgi:hypothetical protein
MKRVFVSKRKTERVQAGDAMIEAGVIVKGDLNALCVGFQVGGRRHEPRNEKAPRSQRRQGIASSLDSKRNVSLLTLRFYPSEIQYLTT